MTFSNADPKKSHPVAMGIAVIAGVVATILRVVPHPTNFSGVGGLGLFGGARLRAWQAYLLPLAIMMVSDIALWLLTGLNELYSPGHFSRLYVYAGFMFYVAIGRWLGERTSMVAIASAATLGGIQFFVLTNFCAWLFQPFEAGYDLIPEPFRYSRDLAGLVTCFAYALGFLQVDVTGLDHPFMLLTNFPMALLFWTCLGDVLFTSIYVLADNKLRQPVAAPTPVPSEATP